MPAPHRPPPRGVWLHGTDPALVPALHILAGQLAAQPESPPCFVTGDSAFPGPGDDLRSIDAQLDHFATRLIVLAGAVLPVPLIERARARGVALMLVDAENPVPSGGWRILPGYARGVLGQFQQIHARDALTASAIARQVRGAVPVFDTGRLARHAPVPGCNILELDALRQSLGARPTWLAHDLPGDEAAAVFAAHAQALRRAHRLLLIVQPRDPAEGVVLATQAAAAGFTTARRAADEEISETAQVYIADSGAESGLFLRLAPVTFLGGSLSQGAGTSSPVPVAALGSALVFGPWVGGEERGFVETLRGTGGGRQILGPGELGGAVSALLSPEVGAEAALKAWTLATDGSDATWTVTRAICDWLRLNGAAA